MERAAGPVDETGLAPRYEAPKAASFVLVGFSTLLGTLFATGAVLVPEGRLVSASLATFFYVKSAFLYLIFRRSRLPVSSNFHLLSREWKWLAVGAGLSALLSLVSGVTGEGLLGWFWGLFASCIAAALWFAARKAAARGAA
jgi:hypothetical protein